MIKQNQNGKDEWIPGDSVPDEKIKEMRTQRREKFRFLQEDRRDEV